MVNRRFEREQREKRGKREKGRGHAKEEGESGFFNGEKC